MLRSVCVFFGIAAFAIFTTSNAQAQLPEGRITSGICELLSNPYPKATFSFQLGSRDAPGKRITGNDWELWFNDRSELRVCTSTDDRSTIVDMGEMNFAEIQKIPKLPQWQARQKCPQAILGHMYAIRTLDGDSDYISLLKVVELTPGKSMKMHWIHWEPEPTRKKLNIDEATRERLAELIDQARIDQQASDRKRVGEIENPSDIAIQIRTGAQGGNPSVMNLKKELSGYRMGGAETSELNFKALPTSRDQATFYTNGGYIPKGKALVVSAIDIFADARGDSNGHGEAKLWIDDRELFSIRDKAGPFRQWLEGTLIVRSGGEGDIKVEVANSSAIDVRLKGKLVDQKEARKLKAVQFTAKPAPKDVERAGKGAKHRRLYLESKQEIVFQVKAGSSSRCRLNLDGMTDDLPKLGSEKELDFTLPIKPDDSATYYFDGGSVPKGKGFIITDVEVFADMTASKNGGHVGVKVGGSNLVGQLKKQKTRLWFSGKTVIFAGQESRVVVAIEEFCALDVRIKGHLAGKAELRLLKPVPFKFVDPPAGVARAGKGVTIAEAKKKEDAKDK